MIQVNYFLLYVRDKNDIFGMAGWLTPSVSRISVNQGGDPDGTGTGGKSLWGKAFRDEFTRYLF